MDGARPAASGEGVCWYPGGWLAFGDGCEERWPCGSAGRGEKRALLLTIQTMHDPYRVECRAGDTGRHREGGTECPCFKSRIRRGGIRGYVSYAASVRPFCSAVVLVHKKRVKQHTNPLQQRFSLIHSKAERHCYLMIYSVYTIHMLLLYNMMRYNHTATRC